MSDHPLTTMVLISVFFVACLFLGRLFGWLLLLLVVVVGFLVAQNTLSSSCRIPAHSITYFCKDFWIPLTENQDLSAECAQALVVF